MTGADPRAGLQDEAAPLDVLPGSVTLEIPVQFLGCPAESDFPPAWEETLLVQQQMTQFVCVEEPLVQKQLSLRTSIPLRAARGAYPRAMVTGGLWVRQVQGPCAAHPLSALCMESGRCTRLMYPVSHSPPLLLYLLPPPHSCHLPSPFLTATPYCTTPANSESCA